MEKGMPGHCEKCRSFRYQVTSPDVQPTLGMPERSLYAALISDLPTLLPACTSWEDHLWAHVQSRMESRLEQRWNDLGGFWQHEEMLVGRDDGEELLGSLDEVFVNIAQTGSVEARYVSELHDTAKTRAHEQNASQ